MNELAKKNQMSVFHFGRSHDQKYLWVVIWINSSETHPFVKNHLDSGRSQRV